VRTYYDLFNLEKDADKQDIRRAFHRLAKQLHPDVSKDDGLFVAVLAAYKTLIDDEKRSVYNDRISDGGFRLTARRPLPCSRVSFALSLEDVVRFKPPARRGQRRKPGEWNPKGYHVRVGVTRAEMRAGSTVEVGVPAHVVCPACGGDRVHCNHCSYRGYVLRAVPVMVPIPTDLSHGAVFAFPLREIKNKRYAFFMVDTLYLKVVVLDR
jgi:molecular chaperone DnaJ